MAVSDSITKQCCTCKQPKSTTEFHPDARSSDGRTSRCRECNNAQRRAARVANPERCRAVGAAYYEKNSAAILATNAKSRMRNAAKIKAHKKAAYEKVKNDPEFKSKIAAYNATRKDQKREYDRAYRERRADHLKAVKAVWNANNPSLIKTVKAAYKSRRRAQESSGDPTAVIHQWELAAPKVCHWCSVKCPKAYHVDHYVPLSKGGKHEVSNLVIACPRCNLTKNAKDPYEFAASVGRLF